jgi:benzoyl-CoA reductase/2-hydroxyglutaryl-CoA dehydratase subunit BcrC/BadD/HgdB
MNPPPEPLMNEGLDGEPAKRAFQYIQKRWEQKDPVVGIYCGFAPFEIMHAMGIVPAVLCAFSQQTIKTAEAVLPPNLCPLIKSSYGFIQEVPCPFFGLSQAVVAETTCDGKKKMFELIYGVKPMFVMDLPQLPDEPEAKAHWMAMIRKLQRFLEDQFGRRASNEQITEAIRGTNRKNRLIRRIFEYAMRKPPVLSWKEIYDVGFIALIAHAEDIEPTLENLLEKLERRAASGYFFGKPDSPRVLVTGCPVGGDATKIFNIIEEVGGIVVAPDACTGIKAFMNDFDEEIVDPIETIANRYLKIPCACMTPNQRRLEALSEMIDLFKPDVVLDFILTACHNYNVESYKVGQHVQITHGLPFPKIETDYSSTDTGQIRTRVEALLEMVNRN